MNLPGAPLNYARDVWQSILNEIRREDHRNAKRDTANRYSGAQDFSGGVRFSGAVSPSQITADQNNYGPAGIETANVLRISSDAARNVTGLLALPAGGSMLLLNMGAFGITLMNESASSSASNRFAIGADFVLATGRGALLWYDSTSARWRLI